MRHNCPSSRTSEGETFIKIYRAVFALVKARDPPANGYVGRLILKFRAECSCLFGSILRYQDIPYDDRSCPLCSNGPESTIHFLTQCSKLDDIRTQFLSLLSDCFLPNLLPPLTALDLARLFLQAVPETGLFSCPLLNSHLLQHLPNIYKLSGAFLKILYRRRNYLLHS